MNLTNINVYAEGYYSGKSHEENVMIRTETFEKLKDEISALNMYFHDLDGKHSEIKGTISAINYTEDQLLHMDFDCANDGDRLDERLQDLFDDNGLNLIEEQRIVDEYINTIDSYRTISVIVRKSQLSTVLDFVNQLDKK